MRYFKIFILVFFLCLGQSNFLLAQQNDSLRKTMSATSLLSADSVKAKDTLTQLQQTTKIGADSIVHNAAKPAKDTFFFFRKKHTPKGATLRSVVFPGWGQAFNREYWKVPIAWAAVGIPLYLYFSNTAEYHRAQFAYKAVYLSLSNTSLYPGAANDPSLINKMSQKFIDYYNAEQAYQQGDPGKIQFLTAIQSYRNSFRQYRDYSILFTILFWGVQVADATVFGHLREFDVSPDISMRITPAYFPLTKTPGITLNFKLK